MKTAYILTRKDLQRLVPFVALWAMAIFIYYAFPLPIVWSNRMSLPQFLPIIVAGAGITLISFIIHNNPPAGTTEFWMTRPVSGLQLLANKFLVVFLLCVLVPMLIHALAKMTGWYARMNDTVFTMFGPLCAAALFFMLLASLTKNMRQYLSAIFGLFIASMIYVMFDLHRTGFSEARQPVHIQYSNVLEWTTSILYFSGLIFIIYNQYTRRNRKITVILSALLALLIFCLWKFWPTVPKT